MKKRKVSTLVSCHKGRSWRLYIRVVQEVSDEGVETFFEVKGAGEQVDRGDAPDDHQFLPES